jgi:hypothetical protein
MWRRTREHNNLNNKLVQILLWNLFAMGQLGQGQRVLTKFEHLEKGSKSY